MYYRTVVNVDARRAELNNATGRMWPAGRSLPTPGLDPLHLKRILEAFVPRTLWRVHGRWLVSAA